MECENDLSEYPCGDTYSLSGNNGLPSTGNIQFLCQEQIVHVERGTHLLWHILSRKRSSSRLFSGWSPFWRTTQQRMQITVKFNPILVFISENYDLYLFADCSPPHMTFCNGFNHSFQAEISLMKRNPQISLNC